MTENLPRMALSIRQPWAWAIINAGKDVENRTWRADFRGPVCIHASGSMTKREWDEASYWMLKNFAAVTPRMPDLQRGGIVGTAEIVDCVDQSDSPWFFGRFGFVLRNPRPVDVIPVKGLLGFFDWRKSIEDQP